MLEFDRFPLSQERIFSLCWFAKNKSSKLDHLSLNRIRFLMFGSKDSFIIRILYLSVRKKVVHEALLG